MIDILLSLGQSLWGILVLGMWLLLGFVHLLSLRDGYIMGVTAGPGTIKRSEQPVKFWFTWLALAFPFVFLPLMAVFGQMLLFFEN